VTTDELPAVDPLDVARMWARRVGEIADYWGERERADPGFGKLQARIHGAGREQFEAAQMAAYLALVSVAGDARRIADVLAPPGPPGPVMPPPPDDRPEDRWRDARDPEGVVPPEGALADARRTREHMGRWAAGGDTHDGEPDPA
jgi:hypothetical protein